MCTDQSGTLAIVSHTHTHTHTHTIANVQPVLHLFQVRSLDLCQKLAAILRLSSFRRLGCCKRNRGKEREREKKKKGERKPWKHVGLICARYVRACSGLVWFHRAPLFLSLTDSFHFFRFVWWQRSADQATIIFFFLFIRAKSSS